jgi:two-component system response regulator ChvI
LNPRLYEQASAAVRLWGRTIPAGAKMPETIVHVEDDADIREAVEKILTSEGYKVLGYSTVSSMFEAMKDEKPALFLLDVMVESDDAGLAAYDELGERWPETPILILTSLGRMILPYFEDRRDRVSILPKPVVPEQLISCVKELIQRQGAPR